MMNQLVSHIMFEFTCMHLKELTFCKSMTYIVSKDEWKRKQNLESVLTQCFTLRNEYETFSFQHK